MIKGVSRNVVEIMQTESDTFERAILFVRPGKGCDDSAQLEKHGRRFLATTKIRRSVFAGRSPLRAALGYLFSAVMGAGATALVLLYF
ncbi:MAG: hypothetical protein FWE32_01410 [Oscillospiraceae bacterium]|nr:hypothetical protein [Oscillospiraceae bacterium]